MVSVAVMKDPDGGAMQKAAAPTYIRMFPASRCARSATGVSLPRCTRWRRAAPNVWDRSRQLPDFLPPLRLTPPMPDQVRTWRRLAG